MERFNKYQKIQLILLVLIIVAAIAFARTIVKNKNTKNFATKEASVGATEIIEEPKKEEINQTGGQEIEENVEDTSWDEENVEDTEVNMEEEEKEQKDNAPYYIKVNYTANCVTVYKKDDSGNYTIPVKALICSTGAATPRSGVYKTSNKYRWHQLNGGVYGQYCTRITGHILFHSVPCSSNTPDSLKYVAYDKLGTTASAGCVRLTVEGALWIYSNCPSGTYVEFYSSSNPGPLGKPSARKISSVVACRNWDPTDPDPRNPWHTYVEPATTTPTVETPTTETPSQSIEPQENQNSNSVPAEEPKQNNTTTQEPPKTENNTNTSTNTDINTNSNSTTENTNTSQENSLTKNTQNETTSKENLEETE